MLTRCPHCQTQFRVTAEQLKIRQGKVRCGVCQQVFDALESLRDECITIPAAPAAVSPFAAPAVAANEGPSAAQETAQPVITEVPRQAVETGVERKLETAPQAEPLPPPKEMPAAEEVPAPQEMTASEPLSAVDPKADLLPISTQETLAEAEPTVAPAPASVVQQEPVPAAGTTLAAEDVVPVPATPATARRWPWVAGIVALSLLCVGQLVYIFRSELAVIVPEARPFLTAACESLGCILPRPLKPDLIGIETSDLVPEGEKLRLTAILKNRAPFVQDHPHLEITLTDTQDAVLVRKVLAPADYLPSGEELAAGFAAKGEIHLDLLLTVTDLSPTGYRLYLFYP